MTAEECKRGYDINQRFIEGGNMTTKALYPHFFSLFEEEEKELQALKKKKITIIAIFRAGLVAIKK